MEIHYKQPKMTPARYVEHFRKDPSAWLLLSANVTTIWLSVYQHWQPAEILVAYWFQSIIIGLFTVLKMLDLRKYSTHGLRVNRKQVSSPPGWYKYFMAIFFAAHYGLFHLVYLMFLTAFSGRFFPPVIFQGAAIFFVNHLLSFLINRARDRDRVMNIGQIMSAPYGRIVPMHLIIVFGMQLPIASIIPVFMLIKTAVDIHGHTVEHFSTRGTHPA